MACKFALKGQIYVTKQGYLHPSANNRTGSRHLLKKVKANNQLFICQFGKSFTYLLFILKDKLTKFILLTLWPVFL